MPALKPEYQHQQLTHSAESSCLSHEELNGPKMQLKKQKKGLSALFTRPWKNRRDGGGATVAVLDSAASATTTTTKTPSAGEAGGGGGGGARMSRGDLRKGNRSVRFNAAKLPTAITLSSSKPNKDRNKDSHLDFHHEESEGSTSSGSYHYTRLLRGAFIEGLVDNYIDRVECDSLDSEGERGDEESNNQWFGEVHMIKLGDLDDAVLDADLWSQAYIVTDPTTTTSSSTPRGGAVDLRHSRSDCSASSNSIPGKLRNFLAKSPVKLRRSVVEEKKKEEGHEKYSRQATTDW